MKMNSVCKKVRQDLIREFGLKKNASYLEVATNLAHGRAWLVQLPITQEHIFPMLTFEYKDREKRLVKVLS